MRRFPSSLLLSWFLSSLLTAASLAAADEVLLFVDAVPAHGVAIARIDLTSAARACGIQRVAPGGIRAFDRESGKEILFEFVPAVDFDDRDHIAGTAVFHVPSGPKASLRLQFGKKASPPANATNGTVRTSSVEVVHDPKKNGGLPSRITFLKTKKTLEKIKWKDRLQHEKLGGFMLGADPDPTVRRLVDGPVATVVRVRARHGRPGAETPSTPEAVYDWYYFHELPLVHVTATIRQTQPTAWKESHFLELHAPGGELAGWVGEKPFQKASFGGTDKGSRFSRWGALVDGPNAVAVLGSGPVLIHDGKSYGPYLHALPDLAWKTWDQTRDERFAWLWLGDDKDPPAAIRSAGESLPSKANATVTVNSVHQAISQARLALDKLNDGERGPAIRNLAAAETLESLGRPAEARDALTGKLPDAWNVLDAGALTLFFERRDGGIGLVGLYDAVALKQLLVPEQPPLFRVVLRPKDGEQTSQLVAEGGWDQVEIQPAEPAGSLRLRFGGPKDKALAGLGVEVLAVPNPTTAEVAWNIEVKNQNPQWTVWKVVFPQVALAEPGPDPRVLVPSCAGDVERGAWRRVYRYARRYPTGWNTMQFMAAYDAAGKTGLYCAMHDPWGSTKDIILQSDPTARSVKMAFDHPAPDMGKPGNDFSLSGRAVWRLLRGDWFDASLIYRDWVRRHAKWYPKLTDDGRADTPRWMQELPAWALGGGAPKDCVPAVKKFAEYLGVPVGFHWYSWHKIPFDNDYPHYFPTKPGFAEGVRELQDAGVYVMPYINGRLWDTHDRGAEDFEFTAKALPFATKDEHGQPYLETYRSKESDGQPVKLAAMCPATGFWQETIRRVVLRLMNECGVKGVYIDQIAAAVPLLCFDKSHGHPLGGGHWWNEGYWQMMQRIQDAMPEGGIVTTECNAEPFAKWFDGYLSWHWQIDGQVPAFPAVYGGAIQMFGRAYRGGATKDLALRMKAGQQLCYGEQIGWLSPGVVYEKDNAAFLRQVVRLRWLLRRYFHAGEMARPPKLEGPMPTVRADWQWSGAWWVETDAVLTGAWRLPKENRLVLFLVNVSEKPVTAALPIDAAAYGLSGEKIRVTKQTPEGPGENFIVRRVSRHELTFPPKTAWAWELTAAQTAASSHSREP